MSRFLGVNTFQCTVCRLCSCLLCWFFLSATCEDLGCLCWSFSWASCKCHRVLTDTRIALVATYSKLYSLFSADHTITTWLYLDLTVPFLYRLLGSARLNINKLLSLLWRGEKWAALNLQLLLDSPTLNCVSVFTCHTAYSSHMETKFIHTTDYINVNCLTC